MMARFVSTVFVWRFLLIISVSTPNLLLHPRPENVKVTEAGPLQLLVAHFHLFRSLSVLTTWTQQRPRPSSLRPSMSPPNPWVAGSPRPCRPGFLRRSPFSLDARVAKGPTFRRPIAKSIDPPTARVATNIKPLHRRQACLGAAI